MRSILLAIPLILCSWIASAECTQWPVLLIHLKANQGQLPVSRGMDRRGNLTVMFENPISLEWSIVEVTPQNCARVIQAGTVWSRQSRPQS